MAPWGTSLPGVLAAAAGRYPDRVAIHDDEGSITYAELWDRAQRVAGALLARGVGEGTRIGLLARNHRGFVEWLVGASATGADVVLLNTGFAGPQLSAVVRSEGITLILHDDEFADVVADSAVETFDEAAIAALAVSPSVAAPHRQPGTNGDPHVGHHGPAEGCGTAERSGRHRGGRRGTGTYPVPARRHPGDRGPALPRLGADESAPRSRTLHEQRAVQAFRRGGDAPRRRPRTVRRFWSSCRSCSRGSSRSIRRYSWRNRPHACV